MSRTEVSAIVHAFLENKKGAEDRVGDLLTLDDIEQRPERGLHFKRSLTDMVKNGGKLSTMEARKYMLPFDEVSPSSIRLRAFRWAGSSRSPRATFS